MLANSARKLIGISFQNRDAALLHRQFESYVMTTDDAKVLYFDGNYESAKKRIQKPKSTGFTTERPR